MSGEPVSAELRQVLRDLKLSGILDTLPERVELARQAHLPYPEFLTVILADEVTRRERVSTTVRARAARLDATMTLEGWDDTTEAVFDRDLWAELCTLRFVEARRDLIVMGPVGVGKTFMASALGHIACRRRFTTLAGRCDQILKRLRGSRLDGSHDTELRKLIRVEVLILTTSVSKPSTPPTPPTSTRSSSNAIGGPPPSSPPTVSRRGNGWRRWVTRCSPNRPSTG
jgi:DNA replication protein DnaC